MNNLSLDGGDTFFTLGLEAVLSMFEVLLEFLRGSYLPLSIEVFAPNMWKVSSGFLNPLILFITVLFPPL